LKRYSNSTKPLNDYAILGVLLFPQTNKLIKIVEQYGDNATGKLGSYTFEIKKAILLL
jgi:hypothetical protein